MKNQYMITSATEDNKKLFYNEDFNIFTVKHGTVYTNKRKAEEKAKFATKYGSGRSGKINVEKI